MKVWTLPVLAALIALAVFLVPSGGTSSPAFAEIGECGNDVIDVPDSGALFNFTAACALHDDCYAAGGDEAARNVCDSQFLAAMQASCVEMWQAQPIKLRLCLGVAKTYYLGVHLFGWLFFPYSTDV
jgi:hypothetical protein